TSISRPDSISGLVSRVRLPAERSSRRASSVRDSGPFTSTSIATERSPGLSGSQLSATVVMKVRLPHDFFRHESNQVRIARSTCHENDASGLLTHGFFRAKSKWPEDEPPQTRESPDDHRL